MPSREKQSPGSGSNPARRARRRRSEHGAELRCRSVPCHMSALCFRSKSTANVREQDCKSKDVSDNAIRLQLSLPYSQDSSEASPVVDFGKIIIYTNNLKIIRAPMDQKELMRRIIQTEGINDWTFVYREKKERLSGGHKKDVENMIMCNQHVQEGDAEHGCSQCKGSGCAPCSLCHGSKFSMLANRFRESYRALRCPACDESGLQPCWVCAA
ncbi:glutaredoxin domain-containing cysteine-rich protein 2 [Geospiza fortis]|uniref:Glutaredoxin domain-containing cysteine-rich protein 2 n=1 Tax=Geospiza fortis TaxID=48883 RepID=A0A6I9ZBQ4_GEOFO|nr:glutaredoxin domain-containing cysteine-rich protein 2 [Geospiza fortis]